MPQLMERKRVRSFARIDILSRMGETICLPEPEMPSPKVRPVRTPPAPERAGRVIVDEEPERWDGLS
jgi:hypothetical protein